MCIPYAYMAHSCTKHIVTYPDSWPLEVKPCLVKTIYIIAQKSSFPFSKVQSSSTFFLTLATKWLPQPGSEDWGEGNVIVTTLDGQLVPKANDFVAEYRLDHGMSEEDALALLQSLTGKEEDAKARELVNKLYRLPLGIST